MNVIDPIMMTGPAIAILRKANVRPTARASMLVAIERTISTGNARGSFLCSMASSLVDSYIILMPMNESRPNASQWSMCCMSSLIPMPASQPSTGMMA